MKTSHNAFFFLSCIHFHIVQNFQEQCGKLAMGSLIGAFHNVLYHHPWLLERRLKSKGHWEIQHMNSQDFGGWKAQATFLCAHPWWWFPNNYCLRLACHRLYEPSNEIHPAWVERQYGPQQSKSLVSLPSGTVHSLHHSAKICWVPTGLQSAVKPENIKRTRLPWWYSGKESACQCKGNGFDLHVLEQLNSLCHNGWNPCAQSLCFATRRATAVKAHAARESSPIYCNWRSPHRNKDPARPRILNNFKREKTEQDRQGPWPQLTYILVAYRQKPSKVIKTL